jgi:adenylate cyclase
MSVDLENLSLHELLRLQDTISQVVKRRFERRMALLFTDVVGSTAYFARYGDEAGRALQERHFDSLNAQLKNFSGRLIDKAGDGAFSAFDGVEPCVMAAQFLFKSVMSANEERAREHHLLLRAGIHWGPVLADGERVSGDAVNLAARLSSAAGPSEIIISRGAYAELRPNLKVRCVEPRTLELKGLPAPVEALRMEWLDRDQIPTMCTVVETGAQFELPTKDLISFGRLRDLNGEMANDVVIVHPDREVLNRISRWHFEIHRYPDGLRLRTVSNQVTTVDGQLVEKGAEHPLKLGSVVRLSGVLTIEFSRAAVSGLPNQTLTDTLEPTSIEDAVRQRLLTRTVT